jgi:hypothetical protein
MQAIIGGVTGALAGSVLTSNIFAMSSNNGPIHIHGTLATDGSFNVLMSRDGTGKFVSGFMAHLPANLKAVDTYPLWVHIGGDASAATGYGSTADLQGATLCIARYPDGSGGGNWGGILPVTSYLPNLPDSFDGSYVDWPIWLGAATAAYRGVRGRLQDITYFPGGASTGSVDNPAGTPGFMVVGVYWYPTNAAPIL